MKYKVIKKFVDFTNLLQSVDTILREDLFVVAELQFLLSNDFIEPISEPKQEVIEVSQTESIVFPIGWRSMKSMSLNGGDLIIKNPTDQTKSLLKGKVYERYVSHNCDYDINIGNSLIRVNMYVNRCEVSEIAFTHKILIVVPEKEIQK